MEALSQATSAVATPSIAPVAPAPAPAMPMANGSMVSSGGGTSLTGMLKELNWVEVGFGILGSAALYYSIYYFKYKFNYEKNLKAQLETEIDDLHDRVDQLENEHKALSQPAQSFDGFGGGSLRAVPTGFNAMW
jgi:hypothetical protein